MVTVWCHCWLSVRSWQNIWWACKSWTRLYQDRSKTNGALITTFSFLEALYSLHVFLRYVTFPSALSEWIGHVWLYPSKNSSDLPAFLFPKKILTNFKICNIVYKFRIVAFAANHLFRAFSVINANKVIKPWFRSILNFSMGQPHITKESDNENLGRKVDGCGRSKARGDAEVHRGSKQLYSYCCMLKAVGDKFIGKGVENRETGFSWKLVLKVWRSTCLM